MLCTGMPDPAAESAAIDDLALARRVVRSVAAVPEAAMRRAALAARLAGMQPDQILWTLEVLIRGTLRKEPSACAAYDCLVEPEPLMVDLGEDRLEEMLSRGVEERCVAAVQWLRSTVVRDEDAPIDTDRLVPRDLREVPLGGRRALARRADVNMLDKLACDPDPVVIENLLNNPRVTEQVVLSLSSRRPTVSAPLESVIASARWGRRYRIRVALAKNPYLRLSRGINLLPYLNERDLVAIYRDATLSSNLRLAAQRLVDLLKEPER